MWSTSSQSREASAGSLFTDEEIKLRRDLVTSPRFWPRQWQMGQEREVDVEHSRGREQRQPWNRRLAGLQHGEGQAHGPGGRRQDCTWGQIARAASEARPCPGHSHMAAYQQYPSQHHCLNQSHHLPTHLPLHDASLPSLQALKSL